MFDDVYADPPERLELQRQRMLDIQGNGGSIRWHRETLP